VPRVQLLGQGGEVQAAGAAAKYRDTHLGRAFPPPGWMGSGYVVINTTVKKTI
jgi:hypothetical protein